MAFINTYFIPSGTPWLRDTVRSLMGICYGQYRYMRDLQDLDRCCPGSDVVPLWPKGPSPIRLPALIQFLRCHPDQAFATYIFEGLSQGFRIGFDRQCSLRNNNHNHSSTSQCPLAVTTRIASEVQRGCLVGPLPGDLVPFVHVNPIGLVPKPHSNTFRMIVDLSAPRGFSVNDGIREEICSLRYASVDQTVSLILRLGQGTMLVKLDLKDAYRIVPVHPLDHPLLGVSWEGSTYADRSIPFAQLPRFSPLWQICWPGPFTAREFSTFFIIWTIFCCSAPLARWRQSRPSVQHCTRLIRWASQWPTTRRRDQLWSFRSLASLLIRIGSSCDYQQTNLPACAYW